MTFHGFIKTDLVNYPGLVAATVFTRGCNFRCPYCHNPQLVEGNVAETYEESEILDYLKVRCKFIDGLVVSGGEPTLHKRLPSFLEKVKALGFAVKLDTNGSNPNELRNLLGNGLVNYVAMDLKAPFSKYGIMGFSDTQAIKESMEILRASHVPYEFRTVCPREILSQQDILDIGAMIQKNEVWKLNAFNPKITLDKRCGTYTSYTEESLSVLKEKALSKQSF